MFNALFWKSAAERSISTAAQTAIAVIGIDAITPILEVEWAYVAGVSATAAALSILKSVAATHVADKGTPSLIKDGE